MHLNFILILGCVLVHQFNGKSLENAENGQFPSLVALLDLKMNYVAAGSLITTYHVFSAAKWHVPGKALMALAGDISLSRTSRKSRQLRSIVRVTVHPNYEDTKDPNFDVAICLVSKPFNLMPNVQPVLISGYPPDVGEYCFSVGWGVVVNGISTEKLESSNLSNAVASSLSFTLAGKQEFKPSRMLLYQQFEIAAKKDCNRISRIQGVCGRVFDYQELAIEHGGPVLCSQKLCGIFINNPRLSSSLVSFKTMKPFLEWVDEEIIIQSHEIANQYYVKRSHAMKKDYFEFWIGFVELLKLLMYFI